MGPVLPVVAVVAAVAGTALSVAGQIQQGKANEAASNYQAQVAANNAQLAKQQAQETNAAGEQQTAIQQMKTRATVGAIRAAEGASGVDVNTGSNVDVRSSAAELGQLDALTIRSNAARQAYGYETGATSFQAQSQLDRATASQAGTAGFFGAAGSLLSGASSVAKEYSAWQQASGRGLTGGTPSTPVVPGGNSVLF